MDLEKAVTVPRNLMYTSRNMAAPISNFKSLWTSYNKVVGLLAMITLGVLFPQFHKLAF